MSDLTVSQVAKELHIRREAVVAFLKRGDLVGYDVTPPDGRRKSYRITRKALDDFKEGRSAKTPAPQKRMKKRDTGTVREFF